MLFEPLVGIFAKFCAGIFKWLDQNMLIYILNTTKNLEYAIAFCCAILFLLATIFIALRQARKLPTSYIVQVVDMYGQKATPVDLRVVFKTFDAAESYAQFYREVYSEQYKFRVIGVRD